MSDCLLYAFVCGTWRLADFVAFFFYSSQAMDVGTLKSVQPDTIRILVWILSFMTFGFATGEFEVTSDRLGVYRPEEHIE